MTTSSVETARAAWRDWLKSERRLAVHTLVAYEHDVATFLGFMTGYLGKPPTGREFAVVCLGVIWSRRDRSTALIRSRRSLPLQGSRWFGRDSLFLDTLLNCRGHH